MADYTSTYTGAQVDARLGSVLALEVVAGTGTQSKTISANTFVSFGTVTSLTVTLGTPTSGITNEYAFEFDSGSTATTLTVTPPSGASAVVWPYGSLTIDANTHYEVSIKYDSKTSKYYGLISGWGA